MRIDRGRAERRVYECLRVCGMCVYVGLCVCARICGGGPGTRRRTTTRATLCLVRRNPSRHSSRLASGDRLNRGPSSCALSSLGSTIRPTSDTLDGARRRPATLGTRSASSPSRYARGGLRVPTATHTPTRGHGYRRNCT